MVWDLSVLPVIERCGYFPMLPSGFDHIYQAPTHAIHLYDYTGRIRIGRSEFTLHPGDITFSPAGVRSAYKLTEPGGHWCIHFHLPAHGGPTQNLPLHLETGTRSAHYRDLFKAIATHHHRGGQTERQQQVFTAQAATLFQELVLSLFALQDVSSSAAARYRHSDQALEVLLAYIEGHLAEVLGVPMLARHVQLSQNYLATLFRQRFGMSLPRYILLRRIESARHLIQTTPVTIKMVGSQVGIPDAQHFNKCFRRHTGVAPSRFRAESST